MTETLFALVSAYGAFIVLLATYLSCLALPIPSSAVMLAGGAFAAAGDLDLSTVALAAFCGAILGDQTGFHAGRIGGPRLTAALVRRKRAAELLGRASNVVGRCGGPGVFFSTWLFAPLGPWVNFVAGLGGMSSLRFTVWDTLGEAIWVFAYVSLGYLFAANLDTLTGLLSNAVGALTAGLIATALAAALWRAARRAQ